jgi:adenylate kinase
MTLLSKEALLSQGDAKLGSIVLIFGPPGSGKGTQGDLLAERMGLKKISTGDIFRRHVREGTVLGKQVESIINAGNLVSDEILAKLVESELTENERELVLLDGYPRTLGQVKDLSEMKAFQSIFKVIYLEVSDDLVAGRMLSRRICSKCTHVYNVKDLKEGDSVCGRCGGELVIREDDRKEKVEARLAIYKEKTLPLLDFFKEHNLLETVKGDVSPDEVCLEISNKLKGIEKRQIKNS